MTTAKKPTRNYLKADFFEMAQVLLELSEADKSSFEKAAKSFGIGKRKAYYLVQVAKALSGFPIPTKTLDDIGWTKLQIIADYLTKENWPELLEMATNLPVHELKDILTGKGHVAGKHCVLFYLTPDEFEKLAAVVEAHGGTREGRQLVGKEKALLALIAKVLK